jgi:hypothetical protein
MALPPKGDPRRPLHLAIRSTRLLGILCVLFGLCTMLPSFPTTSGPSAVLLAGASLVCLLPGAAYFLVSMFLARRQFWAVVLGLVLASLQALFALAALIGVLAALIIDARNTGDVEPFGFVFVLGLFLFLVAFCQLISHLILSFGAIKHVPPEEQHGFEPVFAARQAPAPPLDGSAP